MATVGLSAGAWTAGFAAADLNSLANGSQKTSTLTAPQIDNSAGGSLYVEFEVVLATLSPVVGVGANLLVVLVPETHTAGTYVTGTDGATADDQVRWQNLPYGSIALRLTAASAQTQMSGVIPIARSRYKVAVINRAGVALAASGNQVYWRTSTETVV